MKLSDFSERLGRLQATHPWRFLISAIFVTTVCGVIASGLDLMNVSSYYQQIIKGAIIVGAVWLDQRGRR